MALRRLGWRLMALTACGLMAFQMNDRWGACTPEALTGPLPGHYVRVTAGTGLGVTELILHPNGRAQARVLTTTGPRRAEGTWDAPRLGIRVVLDGAVSNRGRWGAGRLEIAWDLMIDLPRARLDDRNPPAGITDRFRVSTPVEVLEWQPPGQASSDRTRENPRVAHGFTSP